MQFPFAIVDLNDGSTLERWRSSGDYWTGIATLVTNTFLMVMSIGAIRNRYYETFKSYVFFFVPCSTDRPDAASTQTPSHVRTDWRTCTSTLLNFLYPSSDSPPHFSFFCFSTATLPRRARECQR